MASSSNHSVKGYYLLQARGVELLIGAVTCLIPFRQLRYASAWALLGLAMLVVSFFVLNQYSTFPGFNAILPCIGAAVILYSTDNRHESTTTSSVKWLLSRPSMVWIGLLSYSIYLWHWPILAYMRYVYGQNDLPGTWLLAAVLVMLALSVLSYYLVEQPVRKTPFTFAKAILTNYLVPSALLISISFGLGTLYIPNTKPHEALTGYGEDVCHGNFTSRCLRGDPTAPHRFLMTGDSHAAHYNTFVDIVGKAQHWSASVITASSCSPVFDYNEKVLPTWAQQPCVSLKSYFRSNYRSFNGVLFASSWAYQLGLLSSSNSNEAKDYDPDYLEKFKNTLEEISKTTPIYVFADVPLLKRNPFRSQQLEKLGIHLEGDVDNRYKEANQIIKAAIKNIPNVYWIDTEGFFFMLTAPNSYEGQTLYFDTHHLNIYGGQKLAEWFLNQNIKFY